MGVTVRPSADVYIHEIRLGGDTDRRVAGDHAALITEQLRVRAVLESLSRMDQEVLRLTEWERLELSEAAAVLGCSRTAAKVMT